MNIREQEIAKLIELVKSKSKNFSSPKLILIGGYALRAYIPFSRYTRDCDFALKKDGWHIDKIKDWFGKGVFVEAFEKRDDYGFLRCIKQVKMDKRTAKVLLDFMEGQVVGRTEESVVNIDEKFLDNSTRTRIAVGDNEFNMFVPDYTDYLILKIVSARPSDIRDVAALIWKNEIPKSINKRAKELLPYPHVLHENLMNTIIPHISDDRFVNSWRGMFATTGFTEKIKHDVLNEIKEFVSKK